MTTVRDDRFLCTWPQCGRTYAKACKLEEHLRSHTNTRPFTCEVEGCQKSFLRKGHLQRHRMACHSGTPRPFICSVGGCSKAFTLRHHLRRHERLHSEPHPHECPQCQLRFARREQLRRHLARQHGDPATAPPKLTNKTYMCGIDGCSQTFDKWSRAVAHRSKEHSSLQESTCPECGKLFHRRRTLAAHIRRLHAGVRGSSDSGQICPRPECAKGFSSRSALKVHIATVHEGRKPYGCEACGRTFGHKHLLVRHRRIHERQEGADPPRKDHQTQVVPETVVRKREHECPVSSCRRAFWRIYDLRRHMVAVHHSELAAPDC